MARSILMLEYDEDDRYITQSVFADNKFDVRLNFVNSSDDLFAFLIACDRGNMSYPSVILLNHYTKPSSAIDVIKELKTHKRYAHIPIVVLSGTSNKEMLVDCYAAGANSFINKPSSAAETNKKISSFINYWFETVELPNS